MQRRVPCRDAEAHSTLSVELQTCPRWPTPHLHLGVHRWLGLCISDGTKLPGSPLSAPAGTGEPASLLPLSLPNLDSICEPSGSIPGLHSWFRSSSQRQPRAGLAAFPRPPPKQPGDISPTSPFRTRRLPCTAASFRWPSGSSLSSREQASWSRQTRPLPAFPALALVQPNSNLGHPLALPALPLVPAAASASDVSLPASLCLLGRWPLSTSLSESMPEAAAMMPS